MQQEIWFQKYRILGLLGRGGNAEVYLAEHIKLNSFRAIKYISRNNPQYDILCKEAFLLKNLKHSCIPIIYDIEEDEDGSYIVEQYLEGETLKNYVTARGPLKEDSIIHYGIALCDLIGYLHSSDRPVLYVDLKPDNIILSGTSLKLIDFGSAIYQDELSDQQVYSATLGYAAPELYRNGKIDERCDVYGIGMLLYFMATGQNVNYDLEICNIDQIGKCSDKLKKIINHCLKYNPSQRCVSVSRVNKYLSAMIQKNQIQPELYQPVTIAIAGAGPRIGVTHLAFRLCKYITGQGLSCLYKEDNGSGCVYSIKNCYEDAEVKDGIFYINAIPMLAYGQDIREKPGDYNVTVQDFGRLTRDNLPDFLYVKKKLVILGAKDWELELSQQIINMTAEYKDIIYLFNFVNGRQFAHLMKSMGHKESYRIPYEPDPFARITQENGLEFFRELIRPVKKKMLIDRVKVYLNRRKDRYEAKTDIV